MNPEERQSPHYISPRSDDLEESPYDKQITSEEIKRRIGKSMNMQNEPYLEQEKPSYPAESLSGSKLGIGRPMEGSSRSPNRKVLPQSIHNEFEMNNNYAQKIMQDIRIFDLYSIG